MKHGLLLLALAALGTAAGSAPTLHAPLPFDHEAHAKVFDRKDVSCQTCHPVGLAPGAEAPEAASEAADQKAADPHATGATAASLPDTLPAARSTCHGCHLGEVEGAPRRADSACGSCHADLQELIPDSHGPSWVHAHGDAARVLRAGCDDCHQARWCIECHDDRGPLAESPHGPAFRATHGVEARVDPASCSSCHAASSCTECHQTGSLPW